MKRPSPNPFSVLFSSQHLGVSNPRAGLCRSLTCNIPHHLAGVIEYFDGQTADMEAALTQVQRALSLHPGVKGQRVAARCLRDPLHPDPTFPCDGYLSVSFVSGGEESRPGHIHCFHCLAFRYVWGGDIPPPSIFPITLWVEKSVYYASYGRREEGWVPCLQGGPHPGDVPEAG